MRLQGWRAAADSAARDVEEAAAAHAAAEAAEAEAHALMGAEWAVVRCTEAEHALHSPARSLSAAVRLRPRCPAVAGCTE